MYWLLDYRTQQELRQRIIELQKTLLQPQTAEQSEQTFPFNGRKSRACAKTIIHALTGGGSSVHVCDPFSGSGTFAYAALDEGCHIHTNEWEPYAYRMMSAPFRRLPERSRLQHALKSFQKAVSLQMEQIYRTKCPACGHEFMYDSLFYDRMPENYYNPTRHERMGANGENVIFRLRYKCPKCGCQEKRFDEFDEKVRQRFIISPNDFPKAQLIENSRINFTAPDYVVYENLFSSRQKHAVMAIWKAIVEMDDDLRLFFEDTFLSILHNAKFTDYRSKSQDNHCPENRLRETNLYHRFLEKIEQRYKYLSNQNFDCSLIDVHHQDFRDFFNTLIPESCDLVITDPPYGQNAQYFEHAQRVHPFMGYSLKDDQDRLRREVVTSNAPSREDKHTKEQFMEDMQTLLKEAARVTKVHKFVVLYFRPEQRDWLSDLNVLKNIGRQHGLEPLITIPIDKRDPAMRALASAAWTFTSDICFIFYKLDNAERRWYEGDKDIDEFIYLAAANADKNAQGNMFTYNDFRSELQCIFRAERIMRLYAPMYTDRIMSTMQRYAVCKDGKFYLKHGNPYEVLNSDMDAAARLREYIPVVVDELLRCQGSFTFEEYVIHLSSYMENGSRKIIEGLHDHNHLIEDLLLQHVQPDDCRRRFYALSGKANEQSAEVKTSLYQLHPTEFEHLIAEFFIKRGYVEANVIGQACDRGVDILVTNPQGERELVQCKRYRYGNNIGSAPIQRIDSYMRSRKAVRAWVVTTSDFTPEGKKEANLLAVKLINGKELKDQLETYFPGKYSL